MGKLCRARIGLAMRSLDFKNCLCYALLGLQVEDSRHKRLGKNSSILAVAYNDLAMAYGLRGQWELALPMLKMSREIREGLPGFTKDKLFSPLYHEGLVRYYQGQYREAGQILEEARKDRHEALGSNDTSVRYVILV